MNTRKRDIQSAPVIASRDAATESSLEERATERQRRKLKARREGNRSPWFGLGMFGLVGWSIVVPTLAGIGIGAWLDASFPSRVSWKLTLLFLGVGIGFANAYRWMNQEGEEE